MYHPDRSVSEVERSLAIKITQHRHIDPFEDIPHCVIPNEVAGSFTIIPRLHIRSKQFTIMNYEL